MARTYEEILRNGINRALFVNAVKEREDYIQKQTGKAQRRRPSHVKMPPSGTLFAIRNKRLSIREAAKRRKQVIMTYTKITDGTTNKYIVSVYSYRYRKLKVGYRKMLFAFDMEDNHIKGFVLNNVKNVVLTDRSFTPRWPIEIN